MRLASPQDWHIRDAETHQIVRKYGSPSKTGRDLEPNPRSGHVHCHCLSLLIPPPRASLLEFQNPGVMSSREVDVPKLGVRSAVQKHVCSRLNMLGFPYISWRGQTSVFVFA